MDKDGGDGGDAAGKQPPDGLLDAANLFGGKFLYYLKVNAKQSIINIRSDTDLQNAKKRKEAL